MGAQNLREMEMVSYKKGKKDFGNPKENRASKPGKETEMHTKKQRILREVRSC